MTTPTDKPICPACRQPLRDQPAWVDPRIVREERRRLQINAVLWGLKAPFERFPSWAGAIVAGLFIGLAIGKLVGLLS